MNNEQQIGQFNLQGVFENPVYWVAKFKNQQDVIIKTASHSQEDCHLKTKEVFKATPYLLDEIVVIEVELSNVQTN